MLKGTTFEEKVEDLIDMLGYDASTPHAPFFSQNQQVQPQVPTRLVYHTTAPVGKGNAKLEPSSKRNSESSAPSGVLGSGILRCY